MVHRLLSSQARVPGTPYLTPLAAHVQGKGIAIFTGCSHAGVVNICRHAQEVFPGVPLYALVGGLHLVYPNEGIIPETIAELRHLSACE